MSDTTLPEDSRQPSPFVRWFLFLIPVALFLVQASHFWPQTIDDAFITYRYSWNLVQHGDLSFNAGGDWVEGYTNPTWMLLHTIPIIFSISPILFSKLLGALCGLATLFVLVLFTGELRRKRDGVEFLPALLLAGNATFAFWSVQGLETPLFVSLILLSCHLFLCALREKIPMYWCVITGLLAFMTRIDALWFLMFAIPLLFVEPATAMKRWKVIVLHAAAFVAGALLLQLIRYSIFGDWLPNTAYAKSVGDGVDRIRALSQITTFFFANGYHNPEQDTIGLSSFFWLNLVWIPAGIVMLSGSNGKRLLVSVPIFLTALYVWITNGDWMPGFRFFQVVLPFLFISVPFAVDYITEKFSGSSRIPVITLFCLMSAGVIYEQSRIENVYIFDRKPLWFKREAGWWKPAQLAKRFQESYGVALHDVTVSLNRHLPEKTSILMSDIGLPGWVMKDITIIDVDGLTHRQIAGTPSYLSTQEVGKESHLEVYIPELMKSENRPDAILAFEQHMGNGPDISGYVYPYPVQLAMRQPIVTMYSEKWRGIKTNGDVWNHLWMTDEKPFETENNIIALQRALNTIDLSPGLGFLLPYITSELHLLPESEQEAAWKIIQRSIRRCRSDEVLMQRLYAESVLKNNQRLKEFLEQNIHPDIQKSDYWQALENNSLLDSIYRMDMEIDEEPVPDEELFVDEETDSG